MRTVKDPILANLREETSARARSLFEHLRALAKSDSLPEYIGRLWKAYDDSLQAEILYEIELEERENAKAQN